MPPIAEVVPVVAAAVLAATDIAARSHVPRQALNACAAAMRSRTGGWL